MSDINSINKHKCKSCSKEIDFIWASGIYNNNEFSRLCANCRDDLLNDLYKKLYDEKIITNNINKLNDLGDQI